MGTRLWKCFLTLGACVLAQSACYSWQLGAGPSDGGSDTPVADARSDDASDAMAASPTDARDSAITPEASSPKDAGLPSDADTGPSCILLEQSAKTAKAAAKACMVEQPPQCTMFVRDECDCEVFVADPKAAATATYEGAVAALKASSCSLGCASLCSPPPFEALCVTASVGSGLGTACSP